MATITHREMKQFNYPLSNNLKRLRDQELISCDWPLEKRKKFKKNSKKQVDEQQYHCYVYLKLFPSTLKCSIDVILNKLNYFNEDNDSILIAKTRIPKIIQSGNVIRVRLASSLFTADSDVHEDPSLIKLETIKNQSFDKQFALIFKNDQIGPGTIGKLFVECLDPSNGSYTNNPPIFELNLNLSSEHEILLTSPYEKNDGCLNDYSFQCGCILSSDRSRLNISDKCNLKLDDMKLVHRLSEPLRCLWKSIGRQLSPCFSDIDINEINQRYFISEGNRECTYQLLREWHELEPQQANIRYLLTRLKLPLNIILTIHNDIIKTFLLN